jgi:hypothetical protein
MSVEQFVNFPPLSFSAALLNSPSGGKRFPFHDKMSRYLRQYEKEHMKMAMLKQEETFKQQVITNYIDFPNQEFHQLSQNFLESCTVSQINQVCFLRFRNCTGCTEFSSY